MEYRPFPQRTTERITATPTGRVNRGAGFLCFWQPVTGRSREPFRVVPGKPARPKIIRSPPCPVGSHDNEPPEPDLIRIPGQFTVLQLPLKLQTSLLCLVKVHRESPPPVFTVLHPLQREYENVPDRENFLVLVFIPGPRVFPGKRPWRRGAASAALSRCPFGLAVLAEPLTFPVQFIKTVRAEHDAMAVRAVGEPGQMPHLMGGFLDKPFEK